MLVLSRKEGESIAIGGEIVITVFEVSRGRVRLGIEAPREISVQRGEVRRAMEREEERND